MRQILRINGKYLHCTNKESEYHNKTSLVDNINNATIWNENDGLDILVDLIRTGNRIDDLGITHITDLTIIDV